MTGKPKYLKVTWIDAFSEGSGWMKKEDLANVDAFTVESVGILVREDKKMITLALSQAANDKLSQCLTIPKGWIKQKRILK